MDYEPMLTRWAAFLDVKSDLNTMVLVHFSSPNRPARPWPYRENREQRIDWAVENYHHMVANREWLNDDAVPFVTPYTGTEIFAEAFGSAVYCPGDNMPFALPAIEESSEIARLKIPSVEDSTLYEVFEIAEAIRRRTSMTAPVELPDIQSPIDIASLIWKKETFLAAMIDEPSAVLELTCMVEQLLCEFLEMWFREFGTVHGAHFPLYPMSGGFTFSEDEMGEFSPAMFEAFCLPSINRMSDHFGGCSMHCCAHARHQWAGIKQIKGLRLLNLVQPQKVLNDAVDFFGTDVVHYHMVSLDPDPNPPLIPTWARRLPKEAHIVLEANAATREDALDKLAMLRAFQAER